MIKIIIFILLQIIFIVSLFRIDKSYIKIKLTNSRIIFYSTLFFYLSILAFVVFTRITLRNNLNSFDLNNDGFFTGNEINDAQREALRKVSSDTGLTFAPITGILYSIIYFTFLYLLLQRFKK